MNKFLSRFILYKRFWRSLYCLIAVFGLAVLPFIVQVDVQKVVANAGQVVTVYLPLAYKQNGVGPTATSPPPPTATRTPTTPPGCPQGMISCWKFEESSGTTFSDSAGPNDATCHGSGCPESIWGIAGRGLSFDGVDDYLVVPDHPTLAWSNWNSFTIEAWVKLEGSCANNKVFVGKPKAPGGWASWWLGCAGSTNSGAFYVRDANQNSSMVLGQQTINDGVWHHLAGVRDGKTGTLRLFLDGKLEAVQEAQFSADFVNNQPLTLGSLVGEYPARVKMDEVAIYTSVLTEDRIRTHYFLARPYCQVCETPVKIMPLGDSITLGSGGSVPYIGYRRPLYLALNDMGYQVNFVGTLANGTEDFDRDHEGHPGWHAGGHSTRSIQDNVYNWLVANPAEVVLLHVGTNDINDGDQSAYDIALEVAGILEEIDRFDKNITVILALIVQRQSYSSVTAEYNNFLRSLAELRLANGDKLILVDMENALTYPGDMADMLHPNTSGYAKMAEVWRQALVTFLPHCP